MKINLIQMHLYVIYKNFPEIKNDKLQNLDNNS